VVKGLLQQGGLTAYGLLARTGIMRQAWARRSFLALYSAYKTWIEAGPVDRLKEFVPLGSTVIDVGANVGFFTLRFARWVGDGGRVIAIEPDLENFKTLASKVRGTDSERRVRLHRAAAAAQPGSVHLQRNELHPGDHRITFHGEGIVVPAVTIDALVAEAGILRVSLVKIDVQGAEMLVIEGAKSTLEKMHPALFVEVDDQALRDLGTSARALVTCIEAVGYEAYELVKDGPPRKLSHDQLFAVSRIRSYIDVLFLPRYRHAHRSVQPTLEKRASF
jgi:FkbM family methyltransferase